GDGRPQPGRLAGHDGSRRPPRQSGAAGALRRGRAAIFAAQPKGASNMTNTSAPATGAGTGTGKAAALAMLKDGYRVALVGRRKELLDKTAADSGAGDRAMPLPADITQPSEVKRIFTRVKEAWGRLDVLFNQAGLGAPANPMEDFRVEQ